MLSKEKQRALLTKFHQIDKDGNQVLSVEEVREVIHRSGMPESDVKEFMALFDLSGDNKVTLQEYIHALGLDPPPPAHVRSWRNAFNSIDTDGSGSLGRSEIRQLLGDFGYERCTEEEIDQWMDKVDKDRDGLISYEEFVAFLEMSYKSEH